MASNKNITLDSKNTDVQVKIEPGTSASAESSVSSVSSVSERVRNIKVEPGLPITTQRLTSFRLPRDLTLGGNIKTEKPKKVYTPNLNVQRNKKKDDATTVKIEHARPRDSDRGRTRGRGRGKTDRGNIIQSIGIWSEGMYMAPTTSKRSERSESFRDSTDSGKYLEKPKINLNKVIDKAEEEKKLKNLLRDDFSDENIKSLDEKMDPFLLPRIQKIHSENVDDKETDKKPIISVNGQVIKNEAISPKEDKKENPISHILENKANSYILIQFPDCFPGLESCKEELGPKRPSDSNTDNESDIKAKTEYCTLNNLKSGFLGKLEILKSGRTRLRFGENSFFVDAGIQQQFHQELLAAKIDTVSLTGDLINLGPVNNKLICSPDLESMLDKS